MPYFYEGEHPRQAEMNLSDADRRIIDQTLYQVMQDVDFRPFEEMTAEEINIHGQKIDELVKRYPMEAIWDRFICRGYDISRFKPIKKPKFCGNDYKKEHEYNVEGAESNKDFPEQHSTFGLYQPGYDEAIGEDRERIARIDKPNALLFGSYSFHSANEFNDYIRALNPTAQTAVVDLSMIAMDRINPDVGKIEGDVTQLPIKTNSQDIIFTNFLVNFLWGDSSGLATGQNIMKMLEEAYRALKDGGLFVMAEQNPAADAETNISSDMLSLYLLMLSLREAGFKKRETGYAKRYNSHIAKKQHDNSDTRTVLYLPIVDLWLTGGRNGFQYMIKAEKEAD